MTGHGTADALHDPLRMRAAGGDLLSLALIEARNRTLAWLAMFDDAGLADSDGGAELPCAQPAEAFEPALWLAGHAGWYQERWISRNLQRSRGEAADGARSPLASLEPAADLSWDPEASTPRERWRMALPDAVSVRQYLAETLEGTLDLLRHVDGGDAAAMHWFRAALWHEDGLVERFAALAQACGVERAHALAGPQPTRSLREPLWFPAQRFGVGSPRAGSFVPPAERWAHEEQVPEFEIDAQPVSWAQYAEFVEDGGYDDGEWWTPPGWAWLQAQGRRGPRDVEQVRHGVLLRRFGRLQRAPSTQAVVQVSAHEAEAWCRWAGRRLPTEVEWELAAVQGRSRGFVFGDVAEWTGSSASVWPGSDAVRALDGDLRVQRACAWLSPPRRAHPRARRFVSAQRDESFTGFRSCSL